MFQLRPAAVRTEQILIAGNTVLARAVQEAGQDARLPIS